MMRRLWLAPMVCALALVLACARESANPLSPGSRNPASLGAAADGTTLKASAPTPVSPINGERLTQGEPITLVVTNSTMPHASEVPLTYKFEVYDEGGRKVYASRNIHGGSGTTSHIVTEALDGDLTYTWQARAEYQATVGPFSARASFVAPPIVGYIKGNELYDPLDNGKTIGTISGDVRFVPGVGLQLMNQSAFVSYQLPQTLVEGEYSALITNLSVISNTEEPKWRLISMREGDAQFNDNIYRMNVDKRGNGAIAWRFLTGPGPYLETIGAERVRRSFHENLTYFVRASWRGGFFRVHFREGGADGRVIYDFGKPYHQAYTPLPHNVYIGSPYRAGDRGSPGSVAGMIIRQIWVSPRPRPDYINK